MPLNIRAPGKQSFGDDRLLLVEAERRELHMMNLLVRRAEAITGKRAQTGGDNILSASTAPGRGRS